MSLSLTVELDGRKAAAGATRVAEAYFVSLVDSEASGEAGADEVAVLRADEKRWAATLWELLDETRETLENLARSGLDERDQVIADFAEEETRLEQALRRLTGADPGPSMGPQAKQGPLPRAVPPARDRAAEPEVAEVLDGVVRLQATFSSGLVVAWGAAAASGPVPLDVLQGLLGRSGASSSAWADHRVVPLPRATATALAAPVGDVLGWLVALGSEPSEVIGPSLRWLGRVAVWAVELVASGHMVPAMHHLGKKTSGTGRDGGKPATFTVSWEPALADRSRLAALAAALPGAAAAFDPDARPEVFTSAVLTAMVDAICRIAAARVETPAAAPRPHSAADTAEVVIAHFDGTRFDVPARHGLDVAERLERWARPVTGSSAVRLTVTLDPPDGSDLWHLGVLAAGVEREVVPVALALATPDGDRRRLVEGHLSRLERVVPLLRRPGGHRRGEVLLSASEAWELMTETGARAAAAGFGVRIPELSRRRSTPALRIVADASKPSVVGAHQLASVRWSAVFGDVELDAAEIARLAKQARPLVQSRGRWVALDHADLAAAAAALADRAGTTQMTGAEMLRHALGLEGSPLPGGTTVSGNGWAVELLRRAEAVPATRVTTPEGFQGELRSYQADALGWLAFLDGAGLGGCLALDMGLGKTPTVLAHLLATPRTGPVLVVAPPAVVGNWATEAARFAPGLRVVIHHGYDRAEGVELASQVAGADLILTTYGTAVRDVDDLATVAWDRVVVDEAQAIKNPASETARQLRRIPARNRLALTGTPVENGLGDLWSLLDYTNPGLVGTRPHFIAQLSRSGESVKAAADDALRALNGLLVFRRTKAEPAIAAELPERVDQLDHCTMTAEQIGLYQAVIDELLKEQGEGEEPSKGRVLAAITALKQICNHPVAYRADTEPLHGRSGKLGRLDEIVEAVYAADERVLIFTHFAQWGVRLADHLTERFGLPVVCYHGGLPRTTRDRIIADFQAGQGAGALVLSLKAGGTGLNLTAASHVVLYDRWWNPAVEDQARDRAWRIGQTRTVICHRLVCPGTIDERVEEVVAGKRRIADLVLPASSSLDDLDAAQLRAALGLRSDALLADEPTPESDAGDLDEADL